MRFPNTSSCRVSLFHEMKIVVSVSCFCWATSLVGSESHCLPAHFCTFCVENKNKKAFQCNARRERQPSLFRCSCCTCPRIFRVADAPTQRREQEGEGSIHEKELLIIYYFSTTKCLSLTVAALFRGTPSSECGPSLRFWSRSAVAVAPCAPFLPFLRQMRPSPLSPP